MISLPRTGRSIYPIVLLVLGAVAGKGQLEILETPETVEPGKFSVGLGFANYSIVYNPVLFLRAGIVPGLQFGVSVSSVASKFSTLQFMFTPQEVEFDCKVNLIDKYLSAGGGFALGVGPSRGNYSFEGSIYLGYPGKILDFYGALRYWRLYFIVPEVSISDSWGISKGSLGIRFKPLDWMAVYGEVGFMYVEASDVFPQASTHLTTGAGLEFTLPFKLWH